ncbi:unnamed protein product [Cuscuta europaea]|uniref:Uncharacterized protein n=1 Tax=Cuscuta europaea TaxID=41803 RepID=A0A9P0ZWD0_CUSEU|nr:unnamed protein product [Cuscuta europaea]
MSHDSSKPLNLKDLVVEDSEVRDMIVEDSEDRVDFVSETEEAEEADYNSYVDSSPTVDVESLKQEYGFVPPNRFSPEVNKRLDDFIVTYILPGWDKKSPK